MNGPGADIPDTILDTCILCIKIKVLKVLESFNKIIMLSNQVGCAMSNGNQQS